MWVLVVVACDRPKPEIDGFGDFHIGKSTIADGYVCSRRGELTYCSNNPSPALAGHTTSTDLYFRGKGDDAPLVEILVAVNACKDDVVSAALEKKLGDPGERAGDVSMWKQKSAIVVARLPAEPGICEISFLAPTETERIAELMGEKVKEGDKGDEREKVEKTEGD